MKWASFVSELESQDDALAEAQTAIREQLGAGVEPDLVVVFPSPHHDRLSQPLGPALRRAFPDATIAGCAGAGVIGGGHEVENSAGLSITAAHLPGVIVKGFHVRDSDLPSPDASPDEWATLLDVPLDADPHFLVFADPFSTDSEALLGGLDYAYPGAAKIGGLASGGNRTSSPALYLDDLLFREGFVGVALWGDIVVDTVVAQGCRPIGEPMRVTAADRNMLLTVDGESTLQALQQLFERLSPEDRELAQRNLFMGIAMDPLAETVQAGDFLIRNVIGLDPKSGALAVGALIWEGQLVQFHVRDADTSADDLRLSLTNYTETAGERAAEGALLFQCTARGSFLYGRADHDTEMFSSLVGDLPLGGFFCAGEIGPVGGTTHLHAYTSSFGIFRRRTVAD